MYLFFFFFFFQAEDGIRDWSVTGVQTCALPILDKPTFEKVRAAVPNLESNMGRALMSGARTGEMIGVAGPAALMAGLSAAGFPKEDVPRLGRIVLEHIRPTVGNEAIEKFLAGAPALKG